MGTKMQQRVAALEEQVQALGLALLTEPNAEHPPAPGVVPSELELLRRDKAHLLAELAAQRDQCAQLMSALADAKARAHVNQHYAHPASAEVQALRAELDVARQERAAAEEAQDKAERFDQLAREQRDAAIAERDKALGLVTSRNERLAQGLADLRDQLELMTTDRDQAQRELSQCRDEKIAERNTALRAHAVLVKANRSLEAERDATQQELAESRIRLAANSERDTLGPTDVSALQEALSKAQDDFDEAQQEAAALRAKLRVASDERDKAVESAQRSGIASVATGLQRDAFRDRLSQAIQSLETSRALCEELHKANENLLSQLADANARSLGKLAKTAGEFRDELDTSRELCDELRKSLDRLRGDLSGANAELSRVRTDRDKLRAELAAARDLLQVGAEAAKDRVRQAADDETGAQSS